MLFYHNRMFSITMCHNPSTCLSKILTSAARKLLLLTFKLVSHVLIATRIMSASSFVINRIGESVGNLMKCKNLLTLRATVHEHKHAELQHTGELKQEIDTLI